MSSTVAARVRVRVLAAPGNVMGSGVLVCSVTEHVPLAPLIPVSSLTIHFSRETTLRDMAIVHTSGGGGESSISVCARVLSLPLLLNHLRNLTDNNQVRRGLHLRVVTTTTTTTTISVIGTLFRPGPMHLLVLARLRRVPLTLGERPRVTRVKTSSSISPFSCSTAPTAPTLLREWGAWLAPALTFALLLLPCV